MWLHLDKPNAQIKQVAWQVVVNGGKPAFAALVMAAPSRAGRVLEGRAGESGAAGPAPRLGEWMGRGAGAGGREKGRAEELLSVFTRGRN